MIPLFPKFKSLEIKDQKDIEAISLRYPPYSDFNFEIMWSWDFNKSAKISLLNKNLVLLQRNVFTDEFTASFLGNNNLDNTLSELFDFLKAQKIKKPALSLIPEDSLKGMDFQKYFIEIDLNSCDYIYELKGLTEFIGHRYSKKRGKYNSFTRNYPGATVKILDLSLKNVQSQILNLNNYWAQNKTIINLEDFNENELVAIKRFLDAGFKNNFCVGIYDKELIGYSVFSCLPNQYAIGHFTKADISYKGIYEFIMRASAKLLMEKGIQYLNFQEDMGLAGLRVAKTSYQPVNFLRKYFVKKL